MKIVLSCEHASKAVPAQYQQLFSGEGKRSLDSHRGWDPGSSELAHILGLHLSETVLEGQWTRLLLDLNRSPENPGHWSEFSNCLNDAQRRSVGELLFDPYWKSLLGKIRQGVHDAGCVVHLSIHSFVRVLDDSERTVDIGVLFDPARAVETRFCKVLHAKLESGFPVSLRIRENEPYAGTEDGLTKILRTKFADSQYLGIELEVCSDLLTSQSRIEETGRTIAGEVTATIREF